MIKTSNIKGILGLSLFVFIIDMVFAKGSFFTTANFLKYFGPNSIQWVNWVVYIGLIVALTYVIRDVGLKKFNTTNKVKALISILISFMGVTGLMWTLVSGGGMPAYLVLFAGELLILALVGVFVFTGFTKNEEKFIKPFAYRVFVVMVAMLIIFSYHGLLQNYNVKVNNSTYQLIQDPNYTNNPNLLSKIVYTFYLDIPLILYVIIYLFVIYLYAEETKEDLSEEEKENIKRTKEYKKLLGLLGKEIKDAENNFSTLSQMLNNHYGGRR